MLALPERYLSPHLICSSWSSVIYASRESVRGSMDRAVVVKRLKRRVVGQDPELTRPYLIEAMKREAAALCFCQHERVPKFVDWLEVDGDPCIIMERLPGKTLEQGIDAQGPLTWKAARHMSLHVLDALQVIHEAGWIHCDLNPGNILVDDKAVYLIDFGAAQIAGHPSQWEWPLGRHRYMPPEHLLGRTQVPRYPSLCFASDLHQFACLLVYCLTVLESFRRPLDNEEYETDYLTNLGQWMAKPVMQKMRFLSVERRRADIPAGLDHILSRALEPDPRARFASAREMKLEILALGKKGCGHSDN